MIAWNSSFKIGVPEIDEQHEEWVRRCNEFSEAVKKGKGGEEIYNFLLHMQNYTIFHFKEEEGLMRKISYPDIEGQQLQHENFAGKQFWFYTASRFNEKETSRKIVEFVENWIVNHILADDMKIGEFMEKNPGS